MESKLWQRKCEKLSGCTQTAHAIMCRRQCFYYQNGDMHKPLSHHASQIIGTLVCQSSSICLKTRIDAD